MSTLAQTATSARDAGMTREEKFVIFASSLGTVFEWYDFYLYATLAPFFASLFFPPGNDTAALLSAFATYAAGFLVRPFGALLFGRIGDLVGRKYLSRHHPRHGQFDVPGRIAADLRQYRLDGAVPSGDAAPAAGPRMGGEYGGAATYVAEHSRPHDRGYSTSFIQTTATLGFFLALGIILLCRITFDANAFAAWGWRIPFLVSVVLLVYSVYIRLRLNESPIFKKMKEEEGKGSKAPLTDSFLRYPNNKYVLLALLGATAGQGVVWYTGQFYALFFLTLTLKLDYVAAYILIGISLIIGTPLFIVFGWLSDRIGRLKIILAGCLIAAVSYFTLFGALTHFVNPALEKFQQANEVTVTVDQATCQHITPWNTPTPCDSARDFLTKAGVSFATAAGPAGSAPVLTIRSASGTKTLEGLNGANWTAALTAAGYPSKADPAALVIYVTMVYGPIAAFLVELFPTRIRYTSMSLPYHIGNGWFGGVLPLVATAVVASTGNIYSGLWYPIGVAVMTVVIGGLMLRDTKDVNISTGSGVASQQAS
jgi:MFS family permease